MIGLHCLCSASVSSYNWLMKQPSLLCRFFLWCLPCLFILFPAGGHKPLLCIRAMPRSQFEEGEEADLGAARLQRNVNLYYKSVAVLFPSPPTLLPVMWCYQFASCSFLWSIVNITASQSCFWAKFLTALYMSLGTRGVCSESHLALWTFAGEFQAYLAG